MHNSNLNYKHMLQCTKVFFKITCVSLGIYRSHARMGMKFKHLGMMAWPETLRNLVFDTSILHHVFLLLFMIFLCIIMLSGVVLMPFLS